MKLSGRLLLDGELVPGSIAIAGDRIVAVDRLPDAPAEPIIAPGFIDLQVNGGWGFEAGSDPEAIRAIAARLPETGVTAWLPTVISSPAAAYPAYFRAFDQSRLAPGARSLGMHVEGPFLSPQRAGAHAIADIEAADDALFTELLTQSEIRLMTLAPERPGAIERIHSLRKRGVVVSLGHSNATLEAFRAGVDAGATMATHLYNAMSPFGHREPGAIGATLADDRLIAGLIADGVHSHPAAVALAIKTKGAAGIALVTDMMTAAGMSPGTYDFGGRLVISDGVTARRENGALAGSIATMDQAIRNLIAWNAATPAEALTMATSTPARILGRSDLGIISPGALADLVLLDRHFAVIATIVGGTPVFSQTDPTGFSGR
jgi:N-acetylglucosamine-6-phosphate deacetylase